MKWLRKLFGRKATPAPEAPQEPATEEIPPDVISLPSIREVGPRVMSEPEEPEPPKGRSRFRMKRAIPPRTVIRRAFGFEARVQQIRAARIARNRTRPAHAKRATSPKKIRRELRKRAIK